MLQHQPQFTAIIADDELSLLKGLKESINWSQFHIEIVAVAYDGRQAINLIMEHNPDIAIVDIKMPEFSGLDVIRKAKKAQMTTDFIILSGYNDFSYAKTAIKYGAKAYLLKPLNIDEFYDELFRICSERTKNKEYVNQGSQLPYPESYSVTFFNNLIDSKILDSSNIQRVLISSNVNLSDSSCYVLVFHYDLDLGKDSKQKELDTTILKLNETFIHEKHKFWKSDKQKIVGIFNTSNITSFQTAMKCLEVIQQNELPTPKIGLGDTVSSLFECSYSYNRALTALTYELYDENIQIFTYEMICTVSPKVKLSDIDYLPLVQFIVKKDLKGIKDYCNQFVDKLLYVPMPPPNYVFSLCYALFNLIERELSSFTEQDIEETTNANELYQFKQLSQIRQWLIDSFNQLSEYIDAVYGYSKILPPTFSQKEITGDYEDDVIKTAMEYIHNNIHKQIKTQDIARQVHLSPSYFAIYFKNKTNMNLRNYLLWKKMDYARQKLMDPNVSISDVAYDVGYGDYRSFSRAFKNVHGITPSDFQAKRK